MAEACDETMRRLYAEQREHLRSTPASEIVAAGEERSLHAFHRAAERVPAYAALLREKGVAPGRIRSVRDFCDHVPVVDKQWAFGGHRLRDLCVGGDLDGVSRTYASSGHSGVFSFGVETADDASQAAAGLGFVLDTAFGVFDRKTFLINALSMGVKIPAGILPLAETSVRPDVVVAMVKALADEYEQFVLVGEALFLKRVLEDGHAAGVPWRRLRVHLVIGGEFIAENMRTYLAHLLGTDPADAEQGRIFLNMGLTELGISLFRDAPNPTRLRRAAQKDQALRYALFGEGTRVCPEVLHYDPRETFVESLADDAGVPRIVVSVLDPARKLPLLRYDTGDMGRVLSHDHLAQVLDEHGYGSLVPEFHLPVGLLYGRVRRVPLADGGSVSSQEVKEALFADAAVASRLTGFFRITQASGRTEVLVQTREDAGLSAELDERLEICLCRYAGARVPVQTVPYREFPYGFEPDYERKPRYVDPEN